MQNSKDFTLYDKEEANASVLELLKVCLGKYCH